MLTLDRIGASVRYAAGLRRILRDPMTPAEARQQITASVAQRERTFLTILERAVYAKSANPYRALLNRAGLSLDGVRSLVGQMGLEGALQSLYDSGVYVSADEFKGRQPIRRPGFELAVRASDFNNPLADAHFQGQTSGSSGASTRVFIGFDLMERDAAYYACLFESLGLEDRPLAFWHSALHTALKSIFKYGKNGRVPERWFTPTPFRWSYHALKEEYVVGLTLFLSRIYGRALPRTEYVPRGEVLEVARWLAEAKARGRPALLETNHSPAVRVCLASAEHGLDISGTVFHITGEPYTPAKAQAIASAGARGLDRYANVEVGIMGIACAAPSSFDDQHLVADKLALIQVEKSLPGISTAVEALVFTTLLPSTPKLMLNVESGDHATVTQRDCGCPFGELGFNTHLSNIRAYDKLTSEGVTISAVSLYALLEEVLPGRFGGGPTDYQLVEEEVDSLPRVSLVVRPSVGELDEAALVGTVYDALTRFYAAGSAEWRQGETLRVVRRNPYETGSAKIMPLHVIRGADVAARSSG